MGRKWDLISNEFEKRANNIFGLKIPDDITAFLTITGRYPYSIPNNFFYVSVKRQNVNSIVMHELFHFYTWYKFGGDLKKLGGERYNDFKEALTVLLDVEFTDLMNGEVDAGYERHREFRDFIKNEWQKEKNLEKIWQLVKKNFK